ncbi:MAG: transporter substrate-binding domain-containing protein [Anaerovoracaceae bacterium]|jgi:polar amino acid transport system substrate-binding protein
MVNVEKENKFRTLADLENATFAVADGMIIDSLILGRLPNARIAYYRTITDCFSALSDGQVDGVVYDEPVLRCILAHSPDLHIVEEMFEKVDYGFAVSPDRQDLKKAIDDTLVELKESGVYEEMKNRWFPEKGAFGIMPRIELSGKNGTLKYGATITERPFSFIVGDNVNTGFDIELVKRICCKLEMDLEIHNLIFSELIPSLLSGKVDMFGSIFITEERKSKVLFSEPYFKGGVAVMVRK